MECKKLSLSLLCVCLLSGCQLDMRSSVEDYTGSDAAKIRVLDKGVLSLTYYEQDGDCYKETDSKKLTSAFHLSLLNTADYSTGFAKTINMKSPNSFGDQKVKEYSIKPGERLVVMNRVSDQDAYGNNINFTKQVTFIPESNHEYEISAKAPELIKSAGDITITDVTTHASIKGWDDKVCKKKGFF